MKKIATILAVCIITAIASNWMVGNYKKQQEMRMWYERMQSVSVSLNEEKENETQITPIDTQMPQRISPRTQPEPNPSFSTATSEKLNPSRTTDEDVKMRESEQIYNDKCEELDDAKLKYEVEVAKMDLLTARYNAGEISHEEYFASLTEFFDGPFAQYFAIKEDETQMNPIDTQMPQRTSPRTQPEPNPSFSTATSEKLNPSRTTDENAMMREAQRIYDGKCEELDDAKLKYEVEIAKMDLLTARYNAGEISHEEYFASLTEFFDGPFAQYFATLTEFFDGPFAQYFAMRKDLFNSIK